MRRLMALLALYLVICAATPGVIQATISGQKATNTGTTVTYTYAWTGTVASHDVFVDTDQRSGTGFIIGGIGADYLLQDDWLYRFTGTAQSIWSWSAVRQIAFRAGSPATWTVNRADLKETNLCSEASDVIFHTEDTTGNTIDMSALYRHTFTKDSSCGLRLGVASYFEPGSADWNAVINSGSGEIAFALVNPDSGPGSTYVQHWKDLLMQLRAKGIPAYGYIKSRQSGAGSSARPIADYRADLDRWYQWYGTYLTGIFIDEEYAKCTSHKWPGGDRPEIWDEAKYYRDIVAYIKVARNTYASTGGVKIILNPGTPTEECMFTVNTPNPTQDIIQANFETVYSSYEDWRPGVWETKYPKSQFWHLVHTATKSEMEQAVTLARSRHVGHIYVTDAAADTNYVGCTLNGEVYGTWNILPGRCSGETNYAYWSRLKQLTD